MSQVAAEIAAPLSQAKKITMVSDGSGEVGAARITGEVLDIMVKVPTMVNKMTGVDVTNVSMGDKISIKEQRQLLHWMIFVKTGYDICQDRIRYLSRQDIIICQDRI